ncbi:MAG: helix-turn-helix domain-containing protein [Akkermansiaceae bacterium]
MPASQTFAFQVGFQSLSQFNRSFAKLVGCSPSKFREAELKKSSIQA